jgi:hypothetical protein
MRHRAYRPAAGQAADEERGERSSRHAHSTPVSPLTSSGEVRHEQ